MHKCPKCGERELFQFTYDYSKAHRPVVDILCNNCGKQFPPISKLPKQKVMKNIHLLPTDKPSRLFIDVDDNKLKICVPLGGEHMMNQHIYITSSEEIKANVYALINGVLCKTEIKEGKIVSRQLSGGATMDICKTEYLEIILTTDQELDGVQAIQDDFLEWFVNNPSCEFVEVVKEMYMPQSNGKISDGKITHELSLNESLNTLPFYRIIIPKQKLTLEEAARKYANIIHNRPLDDEERYYKDYQKYDGFVAGAKYQADDIIDKLYIHIISNEDDWSRNPQVEFKSFVEQFKKK